jgi:hypothetical protein
MEREAPPSTYDMAITSSTTQNKDNIWSNYRSLPLC